MFMIHILVEYPPECYLWIEGFFTSSFIPILIMTVLIMGYRTIDQTSLGKDRITLALVTKLRERQGELGLSGACLGFSPHLLFLLPPFHTIVAECMLHSHKLTFSGSLETWRITLPVPHHHSLAKRKEFSLPRPRVLQIHGEEFWFALLGSWFIFVSMWHDTVVVDLKQNYLVGNPKS